MKEYFAEEFANKIFTSVKYLWTLQEQGIFVAYRHQGQRLVYTHEQLITYLAERYGVDEYGQRLSSDVPISKILLYLREKKRLTRKEVDYELKSKGCANYNCVSYENGSLIPHGEMIKVLADFYGVTTDYILGTQYHSLENSIEKLQFSETEKEFFKKYMSHPEDERKNISNLFSFMQK